MRLYLRIVCLLFFLGCLTPGIGQDSLDFEQLFEKAYEENIRKEVINGVYIPMDLDDCFLELKRLSNPESIKKFREADESAVSRKLHFGLGRWISSNWNLYEGSRFSHYLKEIGISHPDDMVQFTIVSFHRHLNGVELETEKRAENYKKIREEERLEWIERGKILKIDSIKKGN